MDRPQERWHGWVFLAGRTALEFWIPTWLLVAIVLSEVQDVSVVYAAVSSGLWLLFIGLVVSAIVLLWRGVDRLFEARSRRDVERGLKRLRDEQTDAPLSWDEVHIEVVDDR